MTMPPTSVGEREEFDEAGTSWVGTVEASGSAMPTRVVGATKVSGAITVSIEVALGTLEHSGHGHRAEMYVRRSTIPIASCDHPLIWERSASSYWLKPRLNLSDFGSLVHNL